MVKDIISNMFSVYIIFKEICFGNAAKLVSHKQNIQITSFWKHEVFVSIYKTISCIDFNGKKSFFSETLCILMEVLHVREMY